MPTSMDVSAVGMHLEKLRLDIASRNISMMNNAAAVGQAKKPLSMISNPISSSEFEDLVSKGAMLDVKNSNLVSLIEGGTKLVHEPKNPIANSQGFVEYPDTDHLIEMMNVLRATRAYEANVKAFNAAKAMHEDALNIGK
jgi:flagellar basal-body rod protein FlgC